MSIEDSAPVPAHAVPSLLSCSTREANRAPSAFEPLHTALFDHMLNGLAYCRMLYEGDQPVDFIYLSVNDAFGVQTGLRNVEGRRVSEVVPGIREADPELFAIYGRVARGGPPETFETYVEALQMWFEISVYSPESEHFVAVFDVITERKLAELALRSSEEQFATVFQASPVGIVISKRDTGEIVDANPSFLDIFGYWKEEVIGRNSTELHMFADPEERGRMTAILAKDGCLKHYEGAFLKKNGERGVFLVSIRPIEIGGQAFFLSLLSDYTERRAAEDRLRQAATVFDSTMEGIVVTDANARITAVNAAFCRITGFEEAEVIGRNANVSRSARHDASFFRGMWDALKQTGSWQGELWNRRKNGELYPARMHINAVKDQGGNTLHYVGVFSDITSIRRYEERLEFLANHDPLTDLPNRLLLSDRIDQGIARACRTGTQLAVLFIDLDHFKTINDSRGHAVGDQLLIDVTQRLRGRVRGEDTLARFGGDEFVLVLDPVLDSEAAARIALDLLAQLAAPFPLSGGSELYVGASIGISIYPDDARTAADLIRDADAAMYQAKEQGRNRFCFYTADMNTRAIAQLELEVALRRAVERDEFVLYFQPKADLRTGLVYGAEALIRWQPEGRDLVPPADFIPQAERSGLIIQIGNWVIDAACRQIKLWRDAGFRDLRLAVNVSARQFHASDLAKVVTQALARHAVPASSLELELTESALMADPEAAVAVLAGLKRIGVQLSLDDFGTGYSSFTYLSRFPIDTLKIDQSFVRDIVTEPRAAMIALSIIDLAHRMHLKVVAEGVETEAQANYLRTRDCDEMQGYYFSPPLPAADFSALIRDGKRLPLRSVSNRPEGRTILFVDDEPDILAALRRLLQREGIRVLTAESGNRALELLATEGVQVIISDQRMPQMTGTEFMSRVKELHPDTVRMVLTAYVDLDSVTQAVNGGAIYKFLHKPWNDAQLREQIREAFRYYEDVIRRRCAKPTGPQA